MSMTPGEAIFSAIGGSNKEERVALVLDALASAGWAFFHSSSPPLPVADGEVVAWRAITDDDREVATIQTFGTVTLRNSHPTWVRDDDGRTYEAVWTVDDKGRGYWWDIEAESPVDPVEICPHPLTAQAAGSPRPDAGGQAIPKGIGEDFRLAHDLIQEAKGIAETERGGPATDHLDAAEWHLDNIEAALVSAQRERDEARRERRDLAIERNRLLQSAAGEMTRADQAEAARDKAEQVAAGLREAASAVLAFREGDLPSRGWLRDNGSSRAALAKLDAALRASTVNVFPAE